MRRRAFIGSAAALCAMPQALIETASAAGGTQAATAIIFDARFAAAARLADALPVRGPRLRTRGDVTDFGRGLQSGFDEPLVLHGITTESFAFCLDVLLRERARTALDIERVDRDLHRWTLETFPRSGWSARA